MAEFGPVGFDHHCHRTVAKRLPGEASIVIFCSSFEFNVAPQCALPFVHGLDKAKQRIAKQHTSCTTSCNRMRIVHASWHGLTKFLNHEPVPRRPWGNCAWLKPVHPFYVNAQRNTKDSESQTHALIKNYN